MAKKGKKAKDKRGTDESAPAAVTPSAADPTAVAAPAASPSATATSDSPRHRPRASTPAVATPRLLGQPRKARRVVVAAGTQVRWLDAPERHDYPAASSYLSLIATPGVSRRIVAALRRAPNASFKAKDILRAAQLELLSPSNEHVASDLAKIKAGEPLSPVLLVRGDITRMHPAQIADGYHRVCASYYVDENTDIPVRIVDAP